jgi:choline dehydrogenase-like flavoprotein
MKKIKTDVCIVGTGFSGTFIANALKETTARILMVEKGAYLSRERIEENFFFKNPYKSSIASKQMLSELSDIIYDDPTFKHYEHVNSGKDAFVYSGRHAVGGGSLVWYGNALRKVPNDFRTKSLYGFGMDWPISYDDLEEYFYKAEVEMGVSGPPKDAFSTFRKQPYPLPPFQLPPGAIELNRIFGGSGLELTPSSKARLSIDTPERVACCGAGTCFLFCPADARYNCLTTHLKDMGQRKQVEIADKITVSRLIQKGDRIVEAVAFDREGNEIRIEAEIFILAANAIENARILLLSQFHHLETGFTTRSRAIGKYLTDQVGLWITAALPNNLYPAYEKTLQSAQSLSFYDGPFRKDYSCIVVELFLTLPPFAQTALLNNEQTRSLIIDLIRKGYVGEELKKQVFLQSLGNFYLSLEMEMLPEERNFVALHPSQKNQFGDPISEFHFSVWDQEYLARSKGIYSNLFREIVANAGGAIKFVAPRNTFDHMLGTCRMGTNPIDAVVDENLKSYDHNNLFIVGGSAFPSAGCNNPTLTIAALALRCGDHLVKHFKL